MDHVFFLFSMAKTKNSLFPDFGFLISKQKSSRQVHRPNSSGYFCFKTFTHKPVCVPYRAFKGLSIRAWAELQTDNLYMRISSMVTELSQGLIQNIYIQNSYFCSAELKSFGLFFFSQIFLQRHALCFCFPGDSQKKPKSTRWSSEGWNFVCQ